MPKILITADAVGGVWQYCVELIDALKHEATFVVATMGPRPNCGQRAQLERLPNATLIESDFALEWMPDSWANVEAATLWLRAVADDFAVDLIHLNGYSHAGDVVWTKPVVIVAHSCVRSWWLAVHGMEPPSEWHEYSRRVTTGLQAADCLVAPSATMAKSIRGLYATDQHIQVIHNASAFQFPQTPIKKPQLLAAGRVWDEAKNLRFLEGIADRLAWPIRIAGEGGPVSGIYLGVVSRASLDEQLAAASVFVHPALYEPFGLAVLEAARAGCCLALSDIPSLRELWDGAAVFIDPRNPEQWIAQLNSLAHDGKRRERLAELAMKRASRYSLTSFRDGYSRLYGSLRVTRKESAA